MFDVKLEFDWDGKKLTRKAQFGSKQTERTSMVRRFRIGQTMYGIQTTYRKKEKSIWHDTIRD
jgi:hypothetical protein